MGNLDISEKAFLRMGGPDDQRRREIRRFVSHRALIHGEDVLRILDRTHALNVLQTWIQYGQPEKIAALSAAAWNDRGHRTHPLGYDYYLI